MTDLGPDMMTRSQRGGGGGGFEIGGPPISGSGVGGGGGGVVTTVPTQRLLRIFCSLVGNVGNLRRNRWQGRGGLWE